MTQELKYFIHHPTGVSLDPLQSDQMGNAILMKHLVGTLVRYGNGGQFEPYLAESFKAEDNNTVWRFRLRDGLRCQNSEVISASGYVEGLTKLLRTYAAQGPIPIISDIEGWDRFMEGGALMGLFSNGESEVVFRFKKPAGSGFLEYLSMSYYGYFCRANFTGETWSSETDIVSSGPFQLAEPLVSRSLAKLELRTDWPLAPKTAPKAVAYHTDIAPDAWNQKASIIQANLGWNEAEPIAFRRIWGPPDNIRSVVLNDEGPSRFFKNSLARKVLQSKIFEIRSRTEFRSKSASIARAFYPGSEPHEGRPATHSPQVQSPAKPLLLFAPLSTTDETRYMVEVTTAALRELGWQYTILSPDEKNGLKVSDVASRTKFDLRITNVVAGNVIEPWVVEMMFCSNLGVSFPDPSGRVCELVTGILRDNRPYSVSEAGAEVSQIVHEDASVIPIYHGRTTWYFRDDLDVSRISGDLILPSFEDIGLRN